MTATRWTGHGRTLNWFTPHDWSAGVPMAGQGTAFTDGGSWTISLAGAQAAMSGAMRVVGDQLSFTAGTLETATKQPKMGVTADLTVGGGGAASFAAGTTLQSANEIAVGSTVNGTLTAGSLDVYGVLDLSYLNILQGSVLISGTSAHATLGLVQTISVGGALTVAGGATLDAGPNTLSAFYSYLDVGSASGAGTFSVQGTGTVVTLAHVFLGNTNAGTLVVSDGGTLSTGVVTAGTDGDGTISVFGAGSVLSALNAVQIGSVNELPVASTLTITDGGSVQAGTYGLDLNYGTLALDSSASLTGTIVSTVGVIDALGTGTVTLGNALLLESNDGAQGQYNHVSTVFATGGATLDLSGVISGANDAILSAGSGHVILANAGNSFAAAQLYNATLELAASGAAGAGTLTFTGGAGQAAVLQIDAGVSAPARIAGFAGADTIDLRGFAFGGGVSERFAGGTLTLTGGDGTSHLALSGSYASANFVVSDDGQGGTVIGYVSR